MRKTLHKCSDFEEIIKRIYNLQEKSERKWGKMNVCQMMRHCSDVLRVPQGTVTLQPINRVFRIIGIITRIEMQLFNNGIPHNMPTFQKLIVNFECDFEEEREILMKALDGYLMNFRNGTLPDRHVLFGRMNEKDWGFLEYKHLDHHLKQFNV